MHVKVVFCAFWKGKVQEVSRRWPSCVFLLCPMATRNCERGSPMYAAVYAAAHTCNARLGATRNRSTRNNCLASNHFLPPVFASLPFIPPLLSFTFTLSYIQLCINFKFKFALKVNVWHDNFLSSTFWSNACSIQRFVKTVQSSCFIFEDTQEARVSRVTKYEHCK